MNATTRTGSARLTNTLEGSFQRVSSERHGNTKHARRRDRRFSSFLDAAPPAGARRSCARWSGPTTPRTASRRPSSPPCAPTTAWTARHPRAWVMTIARRKAIDHHRARAPAPGAARATLPEAAAPQQTGGLGDLDGEVWTAVAGLAEAQRAAIALRYAGDLAYREIARGARVQRGGGAAAGGRRAAGAAPGRSTERRRGDEHRRTTDREGPRRGDGREDAAAAARAARSTAPRPRGWSSRLRQLRLAARHRPRRGDDARDRLGRAPEHRADARSSPSSRELSPRMLELPAAPRRGAAASSTSTSTASGASSSSTLDWRLVRSRFVEPGPARDREAARTGSPRPTARSPPGPATRAPTAPPARRSATTRSRSSSPVTASCAPAACSASTAAGRR